MSDLASQFVQISTKWDKSGTFLKISLFWARWPKMNRKLIFKKSHIRPICWQSGPNGDHTWHICLSWWRHLTFTGWRHHDEKEISIWQVNCCKWRPLLLNNHVYIDNLWPAVWNAICSFLIFLEKRACRSPMFSTSYSWELRFGTNVS